MREAVDEVLLDGGGFAPRNAQQSGDELALADPGLDTSPDRLDAGALIRPPPGMQAARFAHLSERAGNLLGDRKGEQRRHRISHLPEGGVHRARKIKPSGKLCSRAASRTEIVRACSPS